MLEHTWILICFRASRRLLAETLHRRISHTITTDVVHKLSSVHSACHTGLCIAASTQDSIDDRIAPLDIEAPEKLTMEKSKRAADERFALLTSRKAHTRKLFSWWLPLWWSTIVWELCSAPQSGWDYGLRVYNVVHEESAIIRSILTKDTATVVRLFRSKEASPFDRDEENRSLLHVGLDTSG